MDSHNYKVITNNNRDIEIKADGYERDERKVVIFYNKDGNGKLVEQSEFNDPIAVISIGMMKI